MVKLSIDIPEKIYDQINKLSDTYSQYVEKTVNEILDTVSFHMRWIEEPKKEDVIPLSMGNKISRRLDSGRMIDNGLFGFILKELNAEDQFVACDMTIDLDDNSIWINYEGLIGSNLFVDSFDVTFTGLKRLTAECTVNIEEDDDYETRDLVEEHARRIRSTYDELPEEFGDLDPWEVSVLAEGETSICLNAHFSEPGLRHLPSIPAISELFEKVLASAGVNRKLSE